MHPSSPAQQSCAVPLLPQLAIRQVFQRDLPALEWDGELTHFRQLFQDVYHNACQGRAVLWIAELPGFDLVGQVFVQLNSAHKELADGQRRAYLYGFRVKSQYRGNGVGTRLIQNAEQDLSCRGFHSVCLNVTLENKDALRLYKRLGYHIIGRDAGKWAYMDENGDHHEVHEPGWRMEKRLIVTN